MYTAPIKSLKQVYSRRSITKVCKTQLKDEFETGKKLEMGECKLRKGKMTNGRR